MRKFYLLLLLSVSVVASAQISKPCGVYEGRDKVDGLVRNAYLEINISDPQVPDFSQTFKRGELYNFKILPSNFMKKPSRFFAGKKATGFIKFSSSILITNSEVLMLTDPQPVNGGYRITWVSDMDKKGSCMMHVGDDGTLWFTGLGTFSKEIGPDNLKLTLVEEPAVKKSYLAVRKPEMPVVNKPKVPAGAPANTSTGGSAKVPAEADLPMDIETDAEGNVIVPKVNVGTLTGQWASPEGLVIKLNSVRKAYPYSGKAYYGLITMDRSGWLKEGVVAVKKLSDTRYALYTEKLDTESGIYSYSEIRFGADGKTATYHLCKNTEVLTLMGKLLTNSAVYQLGVLQNKYYGMFSTGSEVVPVPLNFYFKQTYDDGYGNKEEGYGCLTWSYNKGMRIDHDFIYDAKILENGNVSVKYRCGRTDEKCSALLVWNDLKKTWTVTQCKSLIGEETSDCYMVNSSMKLTGVIK